MEFLENIWVRRAVSFLCTLYLLFLGWLGYMSVFYKIEYVSKMSFLFIYLAVNLFFLGIMLFARKQVYTSILVVLMMILLIPLVLMNLWDWVLILPPVLVVFIMFFACGASEAPKTILGTILLLLYIFSGLGFYIFCNLFVTTDPKDYTAIERGISATGIYRYVIYDVEDNSGGRTEVYVEPNDQDKDFKIVRFMVNGYAQRKYNVRNHEKPTVEWRDGDTMYINNERCDIKEWKWEFTLH